MNGIEIADFIGKKVRIICDFGSEPIFYTGMIASINASTILFTDKFGKDILISLDSIKKVEPV